MEARVFGNGYKLVEGAYGIPVPAEGAEVVPPEEIDYVIVPCVSCDIEGRRLGHGMGWYDRFLGSLRDDCCKTAICYDKLLAEKLPAEPHDIRMDTVMTEEAIYETAGNPA